MPFAQYNQVLMLCFVDSAVDRLEGELMTELENARLVRLLCKFGFINERPEYGPPYDCYLRIVLTSEQGTTTRLAGLRLATGTSSSSSGTMSSTRSTRWAARL